MPNKSHSLRLSITVAFGLALFAPAASGYLLTTGGDQNPEQISNYDVPDVSASVLLSDPIEITIEPRDNIIGRTTGAGIRFSLSGGAQFLVAPFITLRVDLAAAGWSAVVAAGGGPGDDFMVISLAPPNGGTLGIPAGQLLNLTGVELTNLVALQQGGAIFATSSFFDPVSTNPILDPSDRTTALLRSGDPVAFGCQTIGADSSKRIDVGLTDHPSKTQFSSTGQIGRADSNHFHSGQIAISRDPDFSFTFDLSDQIATSVIGSFAAFVPEGNSVFLSPDADCASVDVAGSVSADGKTVTFQYALGDLTGAGPDGASTYLCFEVSDDNTTAIDATSVTTRSSFTRNDIDGGINDPVLGCPLLPLRFNGAVVKAFTFNPTGNALAESFLRVSNWGQTVGFVMIDGFDDTGAPGDSTVRFIVPPGGSLQLNSEDLENGNPAKGIAGALGDGTGRWRLIVTGEFDNMRVSSLNRNRDTGTVTNLTDADNAGEQALNDSFGN
jgi:hypothetical protein